METLPDPLQRASPRRARGATTNAAETIVPLTRKGSTAETEQQRRTGRILCEGRAQEMAALAFRTMQTSER
eukprot:3692940-Pyramimonas_sp.AAC.1